MEKEENFLTAYPENGVIYLYCDFYESFKLTAMLPFGLKGNSCKIIALQFFNSCTKFKNVHRIIALTLMIGLIRVKRIFFICRVNEHIHPLFWKKWSTKSTWVHSTMSRANIFPSARGGHQETIRCDTNVVYNVFRYVPAFDIRNLYCMFRCVLPLESGLPNPSS